ncbi:hypothetical protein CJU89_4588 [Yarrowia sp. B02]|nr:hypothetical protein CJU89_4588 [Yarrowia sp. B02]
MRYKVRKSGKKAMTSKAQETPAVAPPAPMFGSPTTALHTDTMILTAADKGKSPDLSVSLQRFSSTLSLRDPPLPNTHSAQSDSSRSSTHSRPSSSSSTPSSSPDIIAQKGIPVSSIASISAISQTPDFQDMGSVHSTLGPSFTSSPRKDKEPASETEKVLPGSRTSPEPSALVETPTGSSSWWRAKKVSSPAPSQADQTQRCTSSADENPNRASDCTVAETQPSDSTDTIIAQASSSTTTVAASSSQGWWFFSSNTTLSATAQSQDMAPNSTLSPNPAKASASDPGSSSAPEQQEPPAEPSRGWFSWWGSSKHIEASPAGSEEKEVVAQDLGELGDGEVVAEDNKGGGRSWGFWSTGTGAKKTSGEVAVSGLEQQSSPSKEPPSTPRSSPVGSPRLEPTEPDSKGIKDVNIKDKETKKLDGATQSGDVSTPPVRKTTKNGKPYRQNLVIPSPDACFPEYSQRDYFLSHLKKLSSYWVPKHTSGDPALNQYNQFHSSVYRTQKLPDGIKKAVVIGVHGFFPAKVVRTFIGEPTGTSVRFANMGAEAVERWAKAHDMDIEIERIALEGEGKVLQRVDNLYNILMNWIDHVRAADVIFFCAHSQGVPVAVHILARLIENGLVDHKKIGMLAMAGISLGPFYGLDSKFVMRMYSTSVGTESLAELFEFQDTNSLMARKYLQSLRTVLAHNCKISFVGSMNDQLVPLYSSTCMHVAHPCIYRAVYVDGKDVAPEFISDLVSLALLLRNIGSTDHNVIKEVSGAVAGAMTGGGHSKIYNEASVYDLGFQYLMETTLPSNPVAMTVFEDFEIPKKNPNPYNLPYCMRSMQYETLARPPLRPLLENLNQEFDKWKPESKPLRDLKYRLSPIQNQAKL